MGNGKHIECMANLFVLHLARNIHPSLQELRNSYRVRIIQSSKQVPKTEVLPEKNNHLIIVDASQDCGFTGLSLAKQVRVHNSKIPIVILVKESSEEFAQSVLRAKINDYVSMPFNEEDLHACINRCLEDYSIEDPHSEYGRYLFNHLEQTIVGTSFAIQELRKYLTKVAITDSTVLITGETGTGKELVARAIHQNSARRNNAFVCMNCAPVPETLLGSGLFGYESGAFTGAMRAKRGTVELAQRGAMLFDEIGDMSLTGQAKILRAIEERQIFRLGGEEGIFIDVRVMASTNQNLDQLMGEGKFREDLFYRLNVARIHIPPLRERKEDIPILLKHYVQDFNQKFNRAVEGFTDEAQALLFQYSWPGNIRELKNLVEAAFINLPQENISFIDLPHQFKSKAKEYQHFPQAERDRILSTLAATNWNRSKAAQKLHWSRMTLYRKMQKYHVSKTPNGSELYSKIVQADSVTNIPKAYQNVTEPLLQ